MPCMLLPIGRSCSKYLPLQVVQTTLETILDDAADIAEDKTEQNMNPKKRSFCLPF